MIMSEGDDVAKKAVHELVEWPHQAEAEPSIAKPDTVAWGGFSCSLTPKTDRVCGSSDTTMCPRDFDKLLTEKATLKTVFIGMH